MTTHEADQQRAVVDALEAQYGDLFERDTLEAVVEADFKRYDDASVRDFLPVLVERDVRSRLRRRVRRTTRV